MADWIKHDTLFDGIYYECSNCGRKFKYNEDVCPNCGEEMIGEQCTDDFMDEAVFMNIIINRGPFK